MELSRIFAKMKGYQYIDSHGLERKSRLQLILGNKIDNLSKLDIKLKDKENQLPDILGDGSGVWYVSEALKNAINSKISSENISFQSVLIEDKEFYLLCIQGLRDALDRDSSIFTTFENGNISQITKLKIYDSQIENFDLFRLKDRPIHVFVTQKMRSFLENKKFAGLTFLSGKDLSL